MIEPIAQLAAVEVGQVTGDIIKILTGAGGAVIIAYKWIQRESTRADKAQERVDEISDKAIAALSEVSIYLADTSKHLENVGGEVSSQHKITREHVSSCLENIRNHGAS
jgi:hypothetical protein